MSTPEAAYQALYNRADEVLGKPYSDTLMASLLFNSAELATKSDILAMKSDIADLKTEMKEFRTELAEMRSMLFNHGRTMIWAMVALTGIFSAVVAIIR